MGGKKEFPLILLIMRKEVRSGKVKSVDAMMKKGRGKSTKQVRGSFHDY